VTKSVHEETIRIVDEQMKDIDIQMRALDDFVTRARSQNTQHYDAHSQSLKSLSKTAKASYDSIGSQLATTHERSKSLSDDISEKQKLLDEALTILDSTFQRPLSDLRANISRMNLQEYEPTGETPQRTQYEYPTVLPRTETHENLLAIAGPLSPLAVSPSKTAVFSDPIPDADESVESRPLVTDFSASLPPGGKFSQTLPGLREINVNVLGSSRNLTPEIAVGNLSASVCADSTAPVLGRSVKEPPNRKFVRKPTVVHLEGRENATPSQVQALSRSTGRRRSPRIAG
jgi:kinesin family member 11